MKKHIHIYHRILRRKGIYALAWRSILRLIIISAIVTLIFILIQSHINNLKDILTTFLQQWNSLYVLTLFFVSETILGLIPPDFFIVWSDTTKHPILMLNALAILSYSGGLLAYYIGYKIAAFPKIHQYLKQKLSSHFATLHKYGGFIIVFAALLPLPFSTITMASGMIEYPFKKLALLGLFRILRFYIYATVLFQLF